MSSSDDLDPIAAMNDAYCVAPVGMEPAIWITKAIPGSAQKVIAPITQRAFTLSLANRKVKVPSGDGARVIAASRYFLEHRERREYAAAEFAPGESPREGVLNTWSGFAVPPAPGPVKPFLKLLIGLLGGNREALDYVLRWLAYSVQWPGKMPHVAVVLRGGRGVGKGSLAQVMHRIFGVHYRHITQARHLTGNFNAHLADAAFVVVDEATWAGDRTAEATLKALITEPLLMVERKGFDATMSRNSVKVLFLSNEQWVVPAGADERRFAVFDCGEGLRGDLGFFEEFHAWLDGGGAGTVLHHLQFLDLAGWDPRRVPHTAALDRQKIESLSPFDRFVWDRLADDCALDLEDAPWSEEVRRAGIQARFVEYVRNEGRRYVKTSPAEIGRRLRELIGAEDGPRRREGGDRSRTWTVPPLDESRRRVARALGLRLPGGKS